MKQGQILYKVIIIAFTVAILMAFVILAWRAAHPGYYTTMCYSDTAQDVVSLTGLVVRDEVTLSTAVGTVALVPAEGERVGVGQAVAKVYASDTSLAYLDTIEELETEYALLAQASSGTSLDSMEVRERLGWAMAELQQVMADGDTSQLEEAIYQVKSLVYQWEYVYGDSDSAGSMDVELATIEAQISAVQVAEDTQISTVYTGYAGTFSSQVDGYESVATSTALDTMTASTLESLIDGKGISVESPAPVGKIITDSTWCFACTVSETVVEGLAVGDDLQIYFGQGWNTTISMEISRIGDGEDGQVVLVLETDRYMADTTLLRVQEVELILGEVTGLYIPEQALRIAAKEVYDGDSETWETTYVSGVYILVGETAEFREVNLLVDGEDYYLVESAIQGDARQTLNSGDELIITSEEIYDGKVMTT